VERQLNVQKCEWLRGNFRATVVFMAGRGVEMEIWIDIEMFSKTSV